MNTTKWIFVIDTKQYAGNFEREMCAYITGEYGECGVGETFATLFHKEVDPPNSDESIFTDIIEHRPDDHGCCRPCSIWRAKETEFSSVAIFFHRKPTNKMVELMMTRTHKFAKAMRDSEKKKEIKIYKNFKLTITGFRLLKETTVIDEDWFCDVEK